jgi:N6-adenosine-specific RNA methylase IME4
MKKFSTIVADCPWNFSDTLKMSDVKRGASANYPVMSIQDICDLPVKEIADPTGCLLALWVPSSLLEDGLRVMNAWGFKSKSTYVWVKRKKNIFSVLLKNIIQLSSGEIKLEDMLGFGMGHSFRQCHEICLIGINNSGIYKKLQNKSQRSVCIEENMKHSAKPENLQDSLDLMFEGGGDKKIELFARRQRKGWTCLGNEINGKDIKEELLEIINEGKD